MSGPQTHPQRDHAQAISLPKWEAIRSRALAEVGSYITSASAAHKHGDIVALKVTLWGAIDALSNAEIADSTIRETLHGIT